MIRPMIACLPERLAAPDLDLLVVPVFEGDIAADPCFQAVDSATGGLASRLASAEGFRGREDTELSLTANVPSLPPRIVLLGTGRQTGHDAARQQAVAATASRIAMTHRVKSIGLVCRGEDVSGLVDTAIGLALGAYSFDRYRAPDETRPAIEKAVVLTASEIEGAEGALRRAWIESECVAMARDLVNEPGGSVTPSVFARRAEEIATSAGLDVRILGREYLEAVGAGLILGVARGSREGPFLVDLAWRPPDPHGQAVLVGKGITFDTGGLQLKNRTNIEDMKSDMAGAAAALAAVTGAARLGCRAGVRGLLAISDNAIGPGALLPGDCLKALSGKTVEVADTDAEGRLVLADAIALAAMESPGPIIDVATLTGACVVALGERAAGLFSGDEPLAETLLAAGRRAGEDLWRLPMYEHLKSQLKSDIADMKNIGDRWGGAIQGALFLQEFAGGKPWAHLDIAGPAFVKKDHPLGPKGATGFGVRTLIEYLMGL